MAESNRSTRHGGTDTAATTTVDFTALLLGVLGHTDGEYTALGYEDTAGVFHAAVYAPADAPTVILRIPSSANIYFSVNTVRGPARRHAGRGTETDTTRLTALWSELDFKEDGCGSADIAHAIIANLSIILGTRPTVIVESGHGLHAYWPITDGHITNGDISTARALIHRWGRLVTVVADKLHAHADNVYELARMLRVPNTQNNKMVGNGEAPIPVVAHLDTGAPLSIAEIDERLAEVGVLEELGDRDAAGEPISKPDDWHYAGQSCPYVTKIIATLPTDTPPPPEKAKKGRGRHQWAANQAVKLTCALRLGCISETDFNTAEGLLERRLGELRAATGEKVGRHEIGGLFKLGQQRTACKTDEQARTELGNHRCGVPTSTPHLEDTEPTPAPGLLCVEHLENEFWERQSLAHIYEASLARMCSPWAVLANCVARALAQIRPHVTLPPLIGDAGSLNWFGAIAAPSGGGKNAAGQLARILVPSPVVERNLGSGEGMITAYIRYDDKGKYLGLHEAIMFTAAEIDTMTALGSRSGSTTMAVLREGFSGGTLGHAYVSRDKNRHLDAGTYRMTVVLSVQPGHAGGLLDDCHGGTPQRFQWFPGVDQRITDNPPTWTPGPLALPSRESWTMPFQIEIPETAAELIRSERAKMMRGETPELDGHAPFVREKFAYALAVLDGRAEMTIEDWELSGVAAAVSAYVRDWVAARHAEAAEAEAARLGTLRGITNQVADTEKSFRESQQANRIAAWIIRKLTEAGEQGLSEGELRRRAESKDRHRIAAMLNTLAQQKRVKHVAKTGVWVVA
jgi:hypothetical protein